jgi:hypothetical protein
MQKHFNFQILIDSAAYKQYSIGNLNGNFKFTINNIQYYNQSAQLIRLKSNLIQFDNGSPTNDILFNHNPHITDLSNPITFTGNFQTWIDFTVTDYTTNVAPDFFSHILLHCTAEKII